MSTPSILYEEPAPLPADPRRQPCPLCGHRELPPPPEPELPAWESCPTCSHLIRVVQPDETLPADDHPPCPATLAYSVAVAKEYLAVDTNRHLLLLIRQMVAELGGPWPASHIDEDPRWERAMTWARSASWNDPTPWIEDDPDGPLSWLILRYPERHQNGLLGQALQVADLPDTSSTRARLRACLEGVPERLRPPLQRLCLATTIVYGQRREDGRVVYDGVTVGIDNLEPWPLTAAMATTATEVLAVHRRKLACWFGEGAAAPLGPRTGARVKPLDYLDPLMVAKYAEQVAEVGREHDGYPGRVANKMASLLTQWYNEVYGRRYHAEERLDGAPVAYPGGLHAFQRAAHRALCVRMPGLPPLPAPASTPLRRRRHR